MTRNAPNKTGHLAVRLIDLSANSCIVFIAVSLSRSKDRADILQYALREQGYYAISAQPTRGTNSMPKLDLHQHLLISASRQNERIREIRFDPKRLRGRVMTGGQPHP
jgi:hypothetical protein